MHAESDLPVADHLNLELTRQHDLVRVWLGGRLVYQDRDVASLLLHVEAMVAAHAAAAMGAWTRVHAGCATLAGKRFLLTGPKGCGKTTLLLRLLAAEAQVHGDENTLVQGENTVPLPRRFHVREGTLALIGALGEAAARLRRYSPPSAPPFRFADPTVFGGPWRTWAAPASAIVVLEPAFGGASTVEPCQKVEMVRHLLFQTLNLAQASEDRVAELADVVRGCACLRLRLGDLGQAADALFEAAAAL